MSKTALYIHPCHPVTEKAGLEVIRGWLKGDIGGYLIDSLCSVDESWNWRRSLEVRYSLSLHDVLDRVLILNEGDDPHLCVTLGTLKWVDLIYALYARSPTTFTELTTIVAFLFLSWRRGEFSAFTSAPAGVPSILSGYRFVGFRNMRRECCKKLQSIKLVSSTVFGGIGNDVVLY